MEGGDWLLSGAFSARARRARMANGVCEGGREGGREGGAVYSTVLCIPSIQLQRGFSVVTASATCNEEAKNTLRAKYIKMASHKLLV